MGYGYKDVIYRADFQAIANTIDDYDHDLGGAGDCWIVLDRLLNEKDAQLAAAQAENERLREAAQLMVRYFESGNGVPVYRATILGNCEAVIQLRAALAKEPPR